MSSTTPMLSVVVPIYNVGSYLVPCLDSVRASSLDDLEIICVDDGSTDGSDQVIEEYAKEDSRIRVVHVPNGGLGRARNIGSDLASGEFLAFLDSDDVISPDAYELLCGSLRHSGSDIATGRVRRFSETYSRPSGLHMTAIPSPATATHISEMPSLVYDTTAWNKVYRRSFWDLHAFRFPEGVLYEDMPVTIPAHVLARAVDTLTAVIYGWRERGDGSGSITQRRAELSNLRDRLTALEFVSGFLAKNATPTVSERHDRKVLTLDMSLYLNELDVAGSAYREYFREHMSRYLRHVADETMRALNIWDRVAFELIRRNQLEEAIAVVRERKARRSGYQVRRRRVHSYAELPYFRDREVGLPNRIYDVSNRLAVRALIESVEIRDEELHLSGYAFVDHLRFDRPWCAVRAVELRSTEPAHRVLRPMRPVRRPDLVASHNRSGVDFVNSGFAAKVPLRALPARETEIDYRVNVKIVAPGARRGVAFRCAPDANVVSNAIDVRRDGTYVAAYTDNGNYLHVVAVRNPPQVNAISFDRDTESVQFLITVPDVIESPQLTIRSEPAMAPVGSVALEPMRDGRGRYRATVALSTFDLGQPDGAGRSWVATVDGTTGDRAVSRAVVVAARFESTSYYSLQTDRELAARMSNGARLVMLDRRAVTQVVAARWRGGRLTVELDLPPSLTARHRNIHFTLRREGREDVEPDAERRAEQSVSLDFVVFNRSGHESLAPGRWSLYVHDRGSTAIPVLPIEVTPAHAAEVARTAQAGMVRATIEPAPRSFAIRVASGVESDRGAWNQRRLREGTYATALSRPLTDSVLFEAWGGKQYSCNPRAIFEEMRRQGRDERLVWVRRDTSVSVPDGVRWVLLGSREYYECLATARYIVSNDSLPSYYRKRDGSRYLQTWHGTPLKRIAFDIENPQFSNVNYLEEFASEKDKWTQLISPNRYSTEIFRRAFAYSGDILETGYPRNDVFYSPAATARREQVRGDLGCSPNQRLILWAPTWRDDQRDAHGRYGMRLPFDMSAWSLLLGADDLLLFRGHQLTQESIGGTLAASKKIRNVTTYPDIQDLFLASDVLITDYSSVMYDFANTRRPMVFFAWDLDTYRENLRGFYADYEAEAPGPIVTDYEALKAVLGDLERAAATTKPQYDDFVSRYCALEDGHASERAVRALLDGEWPPV